MTHRDPMAEAWRAHLRIAILRALNDDPGRASNESLLMDLVQAVHISADRDQVRDELLWLHAEDLVAATVTRGSMMALLTERGAMVAEGRRTHEGVKRPNVTAAVARKALSISLDRLKR
ncbi:hypothetical protein ACQW02_25440 [Humitalea sp. 24SJ18S-53]|uniref:VpaChn25_0724 family phage protein n=1 Tax=Humitalea sp. 24SJ18S-53 TaxID=3422307 RepID=UPI003D668405